jgi:exopolysaccharide production protein ExoZ
MPLPAARPPAPRVILPIQYLRGIAAMMVVWFHAAEQFAGANALLPNRFGNSGVDLFFVISGFIMVVTTSGSTMSPVEFMRRRIIRVVPLYWLLTLAMVGVALVAPGLFRTLIVTPGALVKSLLFIPHYSSSFPAMAWPLLVPGWTLNFEMFFYLMFALALALPPRWRLIGLALVFATLVTTGLVLGPFDSAPMQVYTSIVMLEFVAGAVIGTWWLRHGVELPRAASAIAIVAGFTMLLMRDHAPLGTFTQIIGAALVVCGALNSKFAAWKLPLLQRLGDSSYSLYLTHLFALGALRVVWLHLVEQPLALPALCVFMAVALIVCAVVGILSWRWIEAPLSRRLQNVGRT